MMRATGRRATAFLSLCGLLSRDGGADPGGMDRWRDCLEVATAHLVGPALWLRLHGAGQAEALPPPVHDYLRDLHDLNRCRNRLIRRVGADAIAALNAAGLRPVVLKGGAFVFDDDRPLGWRIVSDIDLAVGEEHFAFACRALSQGGFEPLGSGAGCAHARTFYRPGDVAPIDLHRTIGSQRAALSAADLVRRARPVEAQGVALAVPHPEDQLLHGLLAAQVLCPNRLMGWIPLRYLLDAAAVMEGGGDAIDWAALHRRLAPHGLAPVLHGWMWTAARLLAQPYPALPPPAAGERLRLWRALAQMDRPWLFRMSRTCAGVAHPFNRLRMDYLYAAGGRPARFGRMRHAMSRLRSNALGRLARAGSQEETP